MLSSLSNMLASVKHWLAPAKQNLEPIKQQASGDFAPMHYQLPWQFMYADGGTYLAMDWDYRETPVQAGPEPKQANVFHTCFVSDLDPDTCPF